VEGSLKKVKSEVSPLDQAFVVNPDQKVGDVLKAAGLKATRFVRLEVGEGIEKKTTDFAAEVQAQVSAAR